MGCTSTKPPKDAPPKIEGPCFVCVDHVYTARNTILIQKLDNIRDLVDLIESYIPLDCPHIPVWYITDHRKEFYQIKPRPVFGPVVWNYYASQHKGVALYVLTNKINREAVWMDETRLKLQILDNFFLSARHPNCFKGFRAIIKNQPLDPCHFLTVVQHFPFWIKVIKFTSSRSSYLQRELGGFYPVVWIIFSFILRAENAPFSIKKQIINFLIEDPYFCSSLEKNWANLTEAFLEALGSPPSLRYDRFVNAILSRT